MTKVSAAFDRDDILDNLDFVFVEEALNLLISLKANGTKLVPGMKVL